MLNRKKRIWEAILIFLGTHLLLFVLLANKSEFVNKLIGDGTPHSPIAFIIIAASAVLWGYTFRLAGFFCRSTDNTPSTKLFNIQFGIWLMTLEMSRNVQSGNTQNLKSSAAPVRLPAAPAPTPGTSQAAAPAGCAYRS